jgi:membrane fusion protein, heavy metal efflux system
MATKIMAPSKRNCPVRCCRELVVFIDRLADNSPVTTAKVSVTVGSTELAAEPQAGGIYLVASADIKKPGKHELVISIQDGDNADLLLATLETPAAVPKPGAEAAPAAAPAGPVAVTQEWISGWEPIIRSAAAQVANLAPPAVAAPLRTWVAMPQAPLFLAIAGSVLAALTVFLLLRRRRSEHGNSGAEASIGPNQVHPAGIHSGLILMALVLISQVVPGPEARAETAAAMPVAPKETASSAVIFVTGDAPRRLSDGTVFLPKPTQRLLEVRTALADPAPHRPSKSLVGRIIANPNRSGLVQSSTGGRLTPPDAGLPRLGEAVKAGQILAYVTPALQAIDSSDITQAAGALDQEIDLTKSKLARSKRLLEQNVVSRVQVEELELEVSGLQKRRGALKSNPTRAEPLTAPVDGVISAARAVLGQVVAPQDVLFEVIDTGSLWVEAFVFDLSAPQTFEEPVATLQDGASVPLTFIGRSRSLRQQSAILHFEIANPPASVDVGMPVTVYAQAGEPVTAIVLPKAAIVKAPSGEDIVWNHDAPERFVALPVKISPFDGSRVLVEAGLKKGQRIVVQSAELINQVR